MNDVILNKAASIERCVKRAREEYQASEHFATDYTRQDAAVLNVIRACEQAIDLANHVVKVHRLGLPNSSRDSFTLLAEHNWFPTDLATELAKMLGFRNVMVYEYSQANLQIVSRVIEEHLDSLLRFTKAILQRSMQTGI